MSRGVASCGNLVSFDSEGVMWTLVARAPCHGGASGVSGFSPGVVKAVMMRILMMTMTIILIIRNYSDNLPSILESTAAALGRAGQGYHSHIPPKSSFGPFCSLYTRAGACAEISWRPRSRRYMCEQAGTCSVMRMRRQRAHKLHLALRQRRMLSPARALRCINHDISPSA